MKKQKDQFQALPTSKHIYSSAQRVLWNHSWVLCLTQLANTVEVFLERGSLFGKVCLLRVTSKGNKVCEFSSSLQTMTSALAASVFTKTTWKKMVWLTCSGRLEVYACALSTTEQNCDADQIWKGQTQCKQIYSMQLYDSLFLAEVAGWIGHK